MELALARVHRVVAVCGRSLEDAHPTGAEEVVVMGNQPVNHAERKKKYIRLKFENISNAGKPKDGF